MSFLVKSIEIGLIVIFLGAIGYYLIPYIGSLSTASWGLPNKIIVGAMVVLFLVCGLMLLFRQMQRGKIGS